MTERLHSPGPPLVDRAELAQLVRVLDDPDHCERPADYRHATEQNRFAALAAALDAAFACSCDVESHVQDASFLGRIVVSGDATKTGSPLVLVVSNFGSMVLCTVENPGAHSDEETDLLVDPTDAVRVRVSLNELGYRLVPEDPFWEPYEGRCHDFPGGNRGTWFTRFFDYL